MSKHYREAKAKRLSKLVEDLRSQRYDLLPNDLELLVGQDDVISATWDSAVSLLEERGHAELTIFERELRASLESAKAKAVDLGSSSERARRFWRSLLMSHILKREVDWRGPGATVSSLITGERPKVLTGTPVPNDESGWALLRTPEDVILSTRDTGGVPTGDSHVPLVYAYSPTEEERQHFSLTHSETLLLVDRKEDLSLKSLGEALESAEVDKRAAIQDVQGSNEQVAVLELRLRVVEAVAHEYRMTSDVPKFAHIGRTGLSVEDGYVEQSVASEAADDVDIQHFLAALALADETSGPFKSRHALFGAATDYVRGAKDYNFRDKVIPYVKRDLGGAALPRGVDGVDRVLSFVKRVRSLPGIRERWDRLQNEMRATLR